MRLENDFTVPAPPEQAWTLLNDIPRVVPCMPGAELMEVVDENTFKAHVHVKLGPISLTFAADIVREQPDTDERVVKMLTKARELKGRGGATATIESSLAPDGSGTRVTIVTEPSAQKVILAGPLSLTVRVFPLPLHCSASRPSIWYLTVPSRKVKVLMYSWLMIV